MFHTMTVSLQHRHRPAASSPISCSSHLTRLPLFASFSRSQFHHFLNSDAALPLSVCATAFTMELVAGNTHFPQMPSRRDKDSNTDLCPQNTTILEEPFRDPQSQLWHLAEPRTYNISRSTRSIFRNTNLR
ncbi:uncharacterized protein EKO05_0004247 [Ascochyta rabiei]|uniref:uncharacterized protein n=1 Tax=Didymella rabiei TaxID=5454 RepID=UPI0022085E78|nr:uncharacterized protein EKO05_0004247 [Ascochyta rabiei]UPX13748.1 hypothetical protein EKO05_0004247 [Ascochyta rabiei]